MKYLLSFILAIPVLAVPTCTQPQQVARVGSTMTVNVSCTGITGSPSYLWTKLAPVQAGVTTQPGLVIVSNTAVSTNITGCVFGPVHLRVAVTDMSGTINVDGEHGCAQTDSAGNIQYTGTYAAKVGKLLGPQTIINRSCDLSSCDTSSGSWADDLQFNFGYHFGQIQGSIPSPNTQNVGFVEDWLTAETGTCTFTNGSTAVTCSGTNLSTSFGCTAPCSPTQYGYIIAWYCTSGSVPTCFGSTLTSGRRYFGFTLLTNTTGTLASNWTLPTCTNCNFSKWVSGNSDPTHPQSWFGGSTNNNYYDDVKFFYELWYRTGIEDYLGYARWLAEAWWTSPYMDQFTCPGTFGCPLPRIQSLEGMLLRAMDEDAVAGMDGASPKWTNLRAFCTNQTQAEVTSETSSLIIDLREESYSMAGLSDCAITDPSDNTNVDSWLTTIDTAVTGRWTNQRHTDAYGPWVGLYCTASQTAPGCNDLSGGTITAAILVGTPTTVTISGGTWAAGDFCDAGNHANVTFGTPPISSTGWDQRGYVLTFVDSTHATLDASYAGTFGSGKVFDLGCGVNNQPAGPATQPFMLGISSNMMRLAAYALTNSGSAPPKDAAAAATINTVWIPQIANWLGTTAVNTKTYAGIPARGPWYFYGGAVCLPPYPMTNADCDNSASAQEVRLLSPELLAAMTTAYCLSPNPTLLGYGNNYYTAMFAKSPSQSGYDGGYVADLDIGGFFWGQYTGKWPGFVWGYGRTQSWLSAIAGCGTATGSTLFGGKSTVGGKVVF